MFQSVRPNGQLYIFHKGDNPFLEMGTVINQPIPKPKYSIPMSLGQPQEMVVDLLVKVNNQNINYNGLPAQLDVADTYSNGESIIVSDSREAMNAEIVSTRQKSIDHINSVDYHKDMVEKLDKILNDFNPELAEKKAQKEEIDSLKNQMSEMSKNIGELMETNRRLIEHLSVKGGQ